MGARSAALLVAVLGVASARPAAANGLTTHVWITLRALERLPEGPLRSLLEDPALRQMLVSGTMFPDGGYAVGHGYGEAAHWEPFQSRYLEWIRARFPRPYEGEARQHLAFLFGMASHGMADQVFDSLYMERARHFDAASDWANDSMDEATDVAWSAQTGAQKVPARWIPLEPFLELYRQAGIEVSQGTLEQGQNLVGFAVAVVGMLGRDAEGVRGYEAQFPWATTHLDEPSVPGRPEHEAELVAEYWQRIWARLHDGQASEDFLLGVVPSPPGLGHPTAAAEVGSRVSFVFSRRLARRVVTTDAFELRAEGGAAIPFRPILFYGNDSHVVHLEPQAALPADAELVAVVKPGLEAIDGAVLDRPLELRFSTRAPPTPPVPSAEPPAPSGCSTAPGASGLQALLLLLAAQARARSRRPRAVRRTAAAATDRTSSMS